MKFCFITPKGYPVLNPSTKGVIGGAEVQQSTLAKELAKRPEHEVFMIVADYGQQKVENIEKIHIYKSFDFKDNLVKKVWNLIQRIKEIDADVYIQQNLSVYAGGVATYCKMLGKKMVHLMAHDSEVDGTHKVINTAFKRRLTDLVFSKSDVIIAQNTYQQEKLAEKNIKSTILKSSYVITSKESPKHGTYSLWVARSESWKKPERFIELAKMLPDENFVMICSKSTKSSQEFYDELREKASECPNLQFLPLVPFSEINDYFWKAKLFISTSEQEGFATTFIHATENKTPILSIGVNPNNMFGLYNCGYCCDDLEEVKDKIIQLKNDSELHNEMCENAYQYAIENHDVRVNVSKLLNLIP